MAKHLERDALAPPGEPHAAIGHVVGEPERGKPLHHRGRRGRSDLHPARKRRGPNSSGVRLKLVDLAKVVLERLAQIGQCCTPTMRGRLRLARHLRSEEHTSELQSHHDLVCRLLLEKKKKKKKITKKTKKKNKKKKI